MGRSRPPMGTHEQWTAMDAEELYEVPRWGQGYFSVSDAGHVLVHPTKDTAQAIDLKQLAGAAEACRPEVGPDGAILGEEGVVGVVHRVPVFFGIDD